ncbi:MAG: NrfD/PsrC family molybdoenzyme membrane anchor subunit [Gordonibacter sp.]|uniref:NrfD/PsrC family molybdoenzyme membrane anchor subunit n=1 Tax=Gordonibacter sp. TaxID=1968902 RepID=UPI002FCC0EC2
MLSTLVIGYLFFGGLGSGTCLVLSCLALKSIAGIPRRANGALVAFEANRLLFGCGFAASFVALALGAVCLVLDLGRFEAIVHLLLNPAPTYISVGAYALSALLLAVGALSAAWLFHAPLPALALRILSVLAIVIAAIVMLYTGLLLMGTEGVRLWNTALVPCLFVLSSTSSGIALLVLTAFIFGTIQPYRSFFLTLAKVDALLIAVELAVLAAFVVLSFLDQYARVSAEQLVSGGLSLPFWIGLVCCGLALPLALEVLAALQKSERYALAASLGVVAGSFLLRWCLVAAATHPLISAAGALS